MQIDSRTAMPGAVIETDICIIGAGPAGITLAREFIGTSLHVLVLESGGFENDTHIQELSNGKVNSQYMRDIALTAGRHRQFGGTPNIWAYRTEPWDGRSYARSVPPEARDFDTHSDDPRLCWPVSFDQLRPHYENAQTVWNGGTFDYRIDTWGSGLRQLGTANGVLETRISQHGPSDVFTVYYRDELLAAENIDLGLGCTAIALEPNGAADRASTVRVARGDGHHFSVAAKSYVLACGGVENVQLLLSSDMAQPGAVGNRHDNIGRYVTDHPEFVIGFMSPGDQDAYKNIGLYDIRWVDGQMVSGFLTLSEEVKRSENLLNMSVAFSPRGQGFGTEAHRAIVDLAVVRQREVPMRPFVDMLSILRSPLEAFAFLRTFSSQNYAEYRGGWSQPAVDSSKFRALELWGAFEQTPHRDNRLSLIEDRDWLGRRKLRFDHLWSKIDRQNIQRSIEIFTAEINAAGLGHLRPWYDLERSFRPQFHGLHHPMGGTRMHVDPQFGVVDENCRVHGLVNVYVAGSSVFPTGIGYSNPTLTLLALTSRLADHLKGQLGVGQRLGGHQFHAG
jgi:choline dehydrogenase-like flavoprotein